AAARASRASTIRLDIRISFSIGAADLVSGAETGAETSNGFKDSPRSAGFAGTRRLRGAPAPPAAAFRTLPRPPAAAPSGRPAEAPAAPRSAAARGRAAAPPPPPPEPPPRGPPLRRSLPAA